MTLKVNNKNNIDRKQGNQLFRHKCEATHSFMLRIFKVVFALPLRLICAQTSDREGKAFPLSQKKYLRYLV